jgi:hypothetical protein|tara:strand:+ start:1100 stop:1279 length:180 start_codon:yes stop_codon:yes gene_type:complete
MFDIIRLQYCCDYFIVVNDTDLATIYFKTGSRIPANANPRALFAPRFRIGAKLIGIFIR